MPEFVPVAGITMIGRRGLAAIPARMRRAAWRRRGGKGARSEFDYARAVIGLGFTIYAMIRSKKLQEV